MWNSHRVSQMGSTGGWNNLGKMTQNCMKITKSTFSGQNSGEGQGRGGMGFRGRNKNNSSVGTSLMSYYGSEIAGHHGWAAKKILHF